MSYQNVENLPRATDLILKVINNSPNGVQTSQICESTTLSKRQVSYALAFLLKKGLIIRNSNLHDLRVNIYSIANKQIEN
ncbi:MAG: winged helix DNA-binding protein [Candidatus Kariarchaeaceae archaeon]|jgi:DNA-binding MarR family transcriptional regulator